MRALTMTTAIATAQRVPSLPIWYPDLTIPFQRTTRVYAEAAASAENTVTGASTIRKCFITSSLHLIAIGYHGFEVLSKIDLPLHAKILPEMDKNRFFVTTAIPYVNAAPHIGHALEFVQTDVVARYHRLIGEETFFLSGTDENALKNVQAAEKAGVPAKQFVDQNSQIFFNLKDALNISFDDFIRTTEDRHVKGAQKLWAACRKDIYKKNYRGLYCVGCEQFYTEKELVEGKCPEHGTIPETVEEENYFFRLSNYQDQLKKLIETDELKIIPETRKNEVLSFINQGLEDFSISRSKERGKDWGVPVPNDPTQIIYVWFDALSNYINGLGYHAYRQAGAEDGKLFKKFWLENPNRVHVIGKGIIRFHAIYWPAMLLSANLPLPTEIFVHGYLTAEGQKISKSLGNAIDPFALAEKYGTDPLRYYLLAKFSPYEDGDFSEAKLKETYNSDLANGLGNLVSRIAKLSDGREKKWFLRLWEDHQKRWGEEPRLADIDIFVKNFQFDKALSRIWADISALNAWINRERPWEVSGERAKQKILGELTIGSLGKGLKAADSVIGILGIAEAVSPFLPDTATKIKNHFTGQEGIVTPATPLFPRLS